jgi:hypothetical protein
MAVFGGKYGAIVDIAKACRLASALLINGTAERGFRKNS